MTTVTTSTSSHTSTTYSTSLYSAAKMALLVKGISKGGK
jgi:hypothetical protein